LTQDIKDRGWTNTLITRFLPVPDEMRPNPHYRSAAPMKLYSLDRVISVEGSAGFRPFADKVAARKLAKEQAHATQMEQARIEHEQAEQRRRADLRARFRGYPGAFARRFRERYSDACLAKTCEALFALNRLAKHLRAEDGTVSEIYSLKNRFIKLLYDRGHCVCAHRARSPEDIYDGITGKAYWAFRFLVAGTTYSWHQPWRLAMWASERGEAEPHFVLAQRKHVNITERQKRAGMALLYWTLGEL
jgi:hypothetical protein